MFKKAALWRRDYLSRFKTSSALLLTAGALALSAPAKAAAQGAAALPCEAAVVSCTRDGRVIYMPGFFSQFNPVTARDMVARVPGFTIDAGDDVRGFAGAAGNVLIDGQRPSTKSASLFAVLDRIGAGSVAYIELIRGGTGGLDVGGQAVVVNVVLRKGADSSGASPWSFSILKRRPNGGVRPNGEISYSSEAHGVKYTIGAETNNLSLTFGGDEEITRFFGDDEIRRRDGAFREQGGGVNLKLEKPFANGDIARFNFEAYYRRFREDFTETRFPAAGGPNIALFTFPQEDFEYEVGGDYEHAFSQNFDVKLIALFNRENEKFESGFEFLPAAGANERSVFISDQLIGETIGRVEFGWKGWKRHNIQFGGEVAHNFIDSQAELFTADAMGALQPVMIDGANTRVAELRGEPFVTDSWSASEKLKIDVGVAVEFSRISQSGDAANSRFFVYPKPSLTFTYNVTPKTQFRLSGKREVNQLDFDEFVSSVNFDDEDFDFGNPDLQPQRAWAFEAAFEQRFGEIGVIELIGFFQYVNDVEDLLPIGGIVEVPGNIGDGKTWGGTVELTVPLDRLGLNGARLESSATIRDSSVLDPVTGVRRRFSFEDEYEYEIEYRQDFPAKKVSWGWSFGRNGRETGFGLDEITSFTYDPELDAFIETTRIKGVKVRFEVVDILNVKVVRDRTVFDGSRALGVPLFREVRGNQNGGGLRLTVSGTL